MTDHFNNVYICIEYFIKVVCQLSQVLWYILVPSCPLFLWKCHILHNLYKVYILHNLHICIFCVGMSYLRSYEMLSHIEMVNIFTNTYGQPDHIFFTPKKLYSVFMKMGIEVVSTKSLSLFSLCLLGINSIFTGFHFSDIYSNFQKLNWHYWCDHGMWWWSDKLMDGGSLVLRIKDP